MDGYHGGPNMGENLADVLNSIEVDDSAAADDEEYFDPEQTVVTKIKRYVVLAVCILYTSICYCTHFSHYISSIIFVSYLSLALI